jgi:prepilin peptidase CpaA
MATPELLAVVPMLLLLAWAAAVDVRSRRIPNWLTASLVATGVAQSMLSFGGLSPGGALGGMLAGFGLTFLLFALGAMGGGDVKLFAGIGAWVGPGRVLAIFAAAAIVGMVIVIYQAARGRRIGALLRNSTVIVANATVVGDLSCPPDDSERSKRLPYAVPTLAGVLIVLFLVQRRWM